MPASFSSVRCVFLDRDGVINVKLPQHQYVTTPEALILCPGAAQAIAKLNAAGLLVFVVTNQRGVALGFYDQTQLKKIHDHLRALLAEHGAHLDAIYFCPHDRDSCECRKPLPGMFERAFRDFPEASPASSLLIGDSLSDIQAGRGLGIETVFIEGDAATRDPGGEDARALAHHVAASLGAFVSRFW